MHFDVIGWTAWIPGVSTLDQWRQWDGKLPSGSLKDDSGLPGFSAIPAILRRRLSRQGRLSVSMMTDLIGQHGNMPIVYCSQHGELTRTLKILEDIVAGEPVSPAAFSTSVHNATAGIFSIRHGLTDNITAIAACGEELLPALMEAKAMIDEGTPKVLCVFSDEPVPDIYQPHCNLPALPYAAAMILAEGTQYQCHFAGKESINRELHDLPQVIRMIRLLLSGGQISVTHNTGMWNLLEAQS